MKCQGGRGFQAVVLICMIVATTVTASHTPPPPPSWYTAAMRFHDDDEHDNDRVPIVCNHAASSFVDARTAAFNSVTKLNFGSQWTQMSFTIVNRINTCWSDGRNYPCIEIDRCGGFSSTTSYPLVVVSGSRSCDYYDRPDRDARVDAFIATHLAMKTIERHFRVKYIPGPGKIGVRSGEESCQISASVRNFDFRNAGFNMGIIITMTPFPTTEPWQRQVVWALPCGFSNDGRPFLIRLNFNPAVLDEYDEYSLLPHVRHALLHALGVLEAGDVKRYDKISPLPEGKTQLMTFGGKVNEAYSAIFGCPKGEEAVVLDEELILRNYSLFQYEKSFGHFESRFVWSDVLAADPRGLDMTLTRLYVAERLKDRYQVVPEAEVNLAQVSVSVSDELFRSVDWDSSGTRVATIPTPNSPQLSNIGCTTMVGARCNTTEGGRYKHFCFPPNPWSGSSHSDSLFACRGDRLAKTRCELYRHTFPIPAHFRYYPNNATLGGDLAADYCPRPTVPAVEHLCNPPGDAAPSLTTQRNRGEIMGANSRCFESTAVLEGQPVNHAHHLRCLTIRCPLKARIEFRLNNEVNGEEWYKCPMDGSAGRVTLSPGTHNGYRGFVDCPPADDVCTDALVPPPQALQWRRVPGYRIEYAVIVDGALAFKKAPGVCPVLGNNSALAFVPDSNFAAAMARSVSDAFPSVPTFWIGAKAAPSTWESTHGYLGSSAVPIVASSKACWWYNVADSSTMYEGDCGANRAIVCTRSIEGSYTVAGCGAGRFCLAPNVTAPHSAREFIIPINTMWTSQPAAASQCATANASLFTLDGLASDMHLPMMQKIATLYSSTGASPLLGLWTGYVWTVDGVQSAPEPPWMRFATAVPTAPGTYSFLLIHGNDTLNFPLQLKPWPDANVAFPSLCVIRNDENNTIAFDGYMQTARVFRVSATRIDAISTCQAFGESLAPAFDWRWVDLVVARLSRLNSALHVIGAAEAKLEYLIGARQSGGTLSYEALTTFPFAAAGMSSTLPTAAVAATLGDGDIAVGNTIGSRQFFSRDGAARPFVCAGYRNDLSNPSGCASGAFCWDQQSDNELMLTSSPPLTAQEAGDACVAAGGAPILQPPLLAPSWQTVILRSFSRSALAAAWSGLVYSAALNSFVANGTVVSGLDPTDPALVDGVTSYPLADGDCMAIVFVGAVLRLRPVKCAFRLPYMCRKALAASDWVPFTPRLGGANKQHLLEYTALVTTITTNEAAQRQCEALDGHLAYFQLTSSFVIGTLFDNAVGWKDKELWFGLSTAGGGAIPKGYNHTFGHMDDLIRPAAVLGCFTISVSSGGSVVSDTARPCNSVYPPLCARYLATVNYSLPSFITAGSRSNLTVILPEVPDVMTHLGLTAASNISAIQIGDVLHNMEFSTPQQRILMSFNVQCSAVSEPTFAGFSLGVLKATTTTGVRTSLTHLVGDRSTIVWPCISFQAGTVRVRASQGDFVSVNVSVPQQMRPGAWVTLNVLVSNATVLETNSSTITLTGEQRFQVVTFRAALGGIANFSVSARSCFPTDLCAPHPPTIRYAMTSFEFIPTAQIAFGVTRSGTQGLQNIGTGSYITLLHNPSPANVTIRLDAGQLFLEPNVFTNVVANVPLYFNFTSGSAATFRLLAHVNITNGGHYDPVANFVPVMNSTYDLGDIFIDRTFPLTIVLNESRSFFYAGEEVSITVLSEPDAVASGHYTDVQFAAQPWYLFRDGNGSVPGITPLPSNSTPNPLPLGTALSPVIQVRSSTCCTYTLRLVVLPQVSPLLSFLSAGSTDLTAKLSLSAAGPSASRFPLPLAVPEFTIRVRKNITVSAVPRVLKTGGVAYNVSVTIPQAPSMFDLVLDFSCNVSTGVVASSVSTLTFKADEFVELEGESAFITQTLAIQSPPRGAFWIDAAHKRAGQGARCAFTFTSGLDFFDTPLPPFEMKIYPRAEFWIVDHYDGRYEFQLPTLAPVNTTFYIALLRGDPYDPNVRSNPVTVSVRSEAAGVTAVQFADEAPFPSGGTWYPIRVRVDAAAPPNVSACVSFRLNSYVENDDPPLACFEVVALVRPRVEPVPAAFLFAQPLGAQNAQTLTLGITSQPRFANVRARVFCMTSDGGMAGSPTAPIAQIVPEEFTFFVNTHEPQAFQITGLIANAECVLTANFSGGADFANTSFVSLLPQPLVFVSLVKVAVERVDFTDSIFVGEANAKDIILSVLRPPSRPIVVNITSSRSEIVVSPTSFEFGNSSSDLLSRRVSIRALNVLPEFVSNATITIESMSSAREMSLDRFTRLVVSVRPLIQTVIRRIGNERIIVRSESVYCNGAFTPLWVNVTVGDLPMSNGSRAMVTLVPDATDPMASRVSSIPSVVSFSRITPTVRSVPVKLQCSGGLARGARHIIPMRVLVAGPSEFAPGQGFNLTLRSLEFFNITFDTSRPLVVGSPIAMLVEPSASPPAGERLELDFVTSCGNAVQEVGSSRGSTPLVWDDSNRQEARVTSISFVLTATMPVEVCEVSLTVSERTTVLNYEYYAYRGTVKVIDVPRIQPVDPQAWAFSEAELRGSGVAIRFFVSNERFATARQLIVKRGPVERDDPAAAVVTSSRAAATGTFLEALESSGGGMIALVANDDGTLTVRISAPSSFIVQVPETIQVTFTAQVLNFTRHAPAAGFNSFNFTLQPRKEEIETVQQGIVGSSVVFVSATSLLAGPALATQGAKLAALLDAGNCPVLDWVATKQADIDIVESPFAVQMGPLSSLGVYMGAAVMNVVFIATWYTVHLVVVFIVYAYRRDQAVGDRSISRALATMRFPSVDTFPLIYFTPLIVEQGLRVTIYSDNVAMRVIAGIIAGSMLVSVPLWLRKIINNPHIEYIASADNREYTFLQSIFLARGKYVIAKAPENESNYASEIRYAALLKYGLIFEDYVGDKKWFMLVDVGITLLLAGLNAFEPTTRITCIAKYGTMSGLFLTLFIAIAVMRPFRRHSWTIFFLVIAFTQCISIGVSVGMLVGATSSANSAEAASIAMMVVGNLLILKSLADLFGVLSKKLFKFVGSRARANSKHRFVKADADMKPQDVFPYLRGRKLDESEWTDALITEMEFAAAESGALQPEAAAGIERKQRRGSASGPRLEVPESLHSGSGAALSPTGSRSELSAAAAQRRNAELMELI